MSVASRATAQLSQELIGHHLPLLNPDFNDIFISMVGGECGISDKPSSFHCNWKDDEQWKSKRDMGPYFKVK